MQLRDYQQAAVDGAYKLWREGKRSVIITMATGCHARGQGILMHDGSVKAVEDVVVGDKLMGPDSTPRTVLSLARGRQEMRRIIPETGAAWTVNLDHVLTLANGGDDLGLRDPSSWIDITVREYLREQRCEWHPLSLIRVTPTGRTLVPFWTEKMPEDDYFGFSLDGDQRYLLDDFTVTHNSGKSVVFKKFAHDVTTRGHRVLLLVEGQDLVEQAANHMRVAGLRVAVEMADQRVNTAGGDLLGDGPQVVVASIDSMARRFARYPAEFFGLIITDECFPAGTLVDGRPIETIKVGDMVRSYNHATGLIERRKVVRLFKNPARALVRLHMSDGTNVVCTPDHPVAVPAADNVIYRPARGCARFSLMRGYDSTQDMRRVRRDLSAAELEQQDGPDLLTGLQDGAPGCTPGDDHDPVLGLRCDGGRSGQSTTAGKKGPGLLLGDLQGAGRPKGELGDHGADQSDPRFATDDRQQSYGESGDQVQDGRHLADDRPQAADARRQRTTAAGTSAAARGCSGVADGGHREDGHAWSLPNSLQAGHRQQGGDGDDRGGRGESLHGEDSGGGCPQDGLFAGPRVDRVEVLQPGSDGGFGEVCPDGHVYNFEVEGNHNYFVNGLLVHNCHHAMAPSYRKVFGHFGFAVPREPEDGGGKYPAVGTCKMVGLTATPDRTDKKQLVPDIFEECAFDYPIKQAIEDGWLVPVKQVLCHLPGYDISKVRTVAGDLNAGELAEVLEPLIKPMVEEIVKVSEKRRRTLVYSVLKKLAHATTDALIGAGAGNVCTIVGETPRSSSVAANDSGTAEQRWPDRERMFEAFRRGDLPYLSSVATLIEGVDLPEAEVAAVLRPTKSGLVYTQIAGRVFRPLPGIVDGLKTAEERRAAIAASAKPYCIILDFAGNAGRHKLVRVLDLFADGLTEAQRKAADKLIESGECEDVLEAIERAREIIAEMERERAGRGVTSTNVDPFDVLAIPYARDQFDRPATEGQLMTLLRHGAVKGNIDKDRDKMLALAREKFDRTSASMYIDVVIQRTKAKQSTIKQAMLLVGKGIPAAVAKEMSFDRASAAMTELASMGWKPTPAWLDKYRKPQGEVAA